MGRWSYSSRTEADSLKQVSIRFLKKHGYLNTGWRSGTITWSRFGETTGSIGVESHIEESQQYIKFNYNQTDSYSGEKRDFNYEIPLTKTDCNFGGKRYWFICPWYTNGRYCGRRVSVLYKDGDYFACRHCYDLTYNSRNLSCFSKIAGQVISFPELERLESEVKRKYYSGKMTRKYKSFLKKQDKSFYQMQVAVAALGKAK